MHAKPFKLAYGRSAVICHSLPHEKYAGVSDIRCTPVGVWACDGIRTAERASVASKLLSALSWLRLDVHDP